MDLNYSAGFDQNSRMLFWREHGREAERSLRRQPKGEGRSPNHSPRFRHSMTARKTADHIFQFSSEIKNMLGSERS
jgi:hypothetical protein